MVTETAGLRDMQGANRRARIVRRHLSMGGVTVSAGGGYEEPALDQPFSVNAVEITVNDLGSPVLDAGSGLLSSLVTGRTEVWNVAGEGRGGRDGLFENAMFGMAIDTSGGIRIVLVDQLSMNPFLEHMDLIGMADRAVDSRSRSLARARQRW